MTRNESTAFLRSDEDDPDFLRDKPLGRCPWCDGPLSRMHVATPPGMEMDCASCDDWDWGMTELDNRARYQEERMAEARVQERVNREVRRSGREDSY